MTCIICGKKAKVRFSPDLDINGFGACSKHKDQVTAAYVCLVTGDIKHFKQLIKSQCKNTK